MEVERQRYEVLAQETADGKIVVTGERKIGGTEKFEFGQQSDPMSRVIGGGYVSHWTVDFLQKYFGNKGVCSRFYFDRKVAVDIGDPEEDSVQKKRKLLFKHGFGYLCIPENFPQDENRLRKLYKAAIAEYYQYESAHPRPAVLQETTIIDSKGEVRRAFVHAIETKVGGGVTTNVAQQEREFKQAKKMSKSELEMRKLQAKLHKRLRRSAQSGIPFRNPFIAKGKRLFPVTYASA
jgi:hypothetical protein